MSSRAGLLRVGIGAGLVAGWWLLRGRVAGGVGAAYGGWVGWVGVGLWGALLVALLVVVMGAKRTGPEAGMAVGCLWITIFAVAGVLGILALGMGMGWEWVVNWISFGGMGVAALLGVQLVWARVKGRGRR